MLRYFKDKTGTSRGVGRWLSGFGALVEYLACPNGAAWWNKV